jgi:hypothetical protein
MEVFLTILSYGLILCVCLGLAFILVHIVLFCVDQLNEDK